MDLCSHAARTAAHTDQEMSLRAQRGTDFRPASYFLVPAAYRSRAASARLRTQHRRGPSGYATSAIRLHTVGHCCTQIRSSKPGCDGGRVKTVTGVAE